MPEGRDRDAETRAAAWLAAWDGQGIHRTGTDGDHAGAEWLAHEAATPGAHVTIEEFALDRLDPISCFLDIGGTRIPAIPAFDAPATGPAGIEGRLDADLAVAELTPRAVYSGEYERLRRAAGRGLVIVCAGDNPGFGLLNAERFRAPYGTPAIHVSSDDRDRVLAAAAQHAPARLVAESRRTRTQARNIVATLPGANGNAPPLIVMTPRSSWWQSTAERGGGIVCWLESLRALLAEAEPPARSVIFTANSGHELDHLGLDDFVARRPGCEETAIWVHYGANIGAAGGRLSLMSASDDLRVLGGRELERAGQPHSLSPKTAVPSGETRDIHKKGGRYLTLVGTNPWFHLPQDRWPHAIDLPAVAAIAAASARLVRYLAHAPP